MNYKAPFPWFGGKSKVAAEVWRRFGDVTNYVEPFLVVARGYSNLHIGWGNFQNWSD